ncbi:hypothetical protein NUSPORA_00921 [Nucleospora cyclopteri]
MSSRQIISDEEVLQWLNTVLGADYKCMNIHDILRDGIILVKIIKKCMGIKTNLPHKLASPFFMMENIEFFILQCKKLGVPDNENFMTVDLFENKNMDQVKMCLGSLSRIVNKKNENCPVMGPRLNEKRVYNFSQEVLDQMKLATGGLMSMCNKKEREQTRKQNK